MTNKLFAYLVVLVLAISSVAGGVLFFVPEQRKMLLECKGAFEEVEDFYRADDSVGRGMLASDVVKKPGVWFLRSWVAGKQIINAKLVTKPFKCETKYLSIPLSGYPANDGNNIYLERIKDGQRMSFKYGNLHEDWQEYVVKLDGDWIGEELRLGAVSKTQYVGVGTPFSVTWFTYMKSSVFVALFWCVVSMAWLVLLGAVVWSFIYKVYKRRSIAVALVPAYLLLVGYILFFVYYYSTLAGNVVVAGLTGVGAYLVLRQLICVGGWWRFGGFSRVTLAWCVVVALLVSALCLQRTNSLSFMSNYRFAPACWSTDNQIPGFVAGKLADEPGFIGVKMGSWRISDRTTALSGLLVPFVKLSNALNPSDGRMIGGWLVQMTSIVAISTFVFPLWVALAWIKSRQRLLVVVSVFLSPFIFFNSVYVWPKLLSGALALSAWIIVRRWRVGERLLSESILVGGLLALSLMAHGGGVFAALIMFLYILYLLRKHLLMFTVASLVFIGTLLPWMVWVRVYDPPGNALTKYAFAGTFGFGEENVGVKETILRSYSKESMGSIVDRKLEGVKTLVGLSVPDVDHNGQARREYSVRAAQFYSLVPAIVIYLSAASISIFFLGSWRSSIGISNNPPFRDRTLLLLGCLGLLIQLILVWDKFYLHHLSYGIIVFMHVGLLWFISSGPSWLLRSFCYVSLTQFVLTWLIWPIMEFGQLSWASVFVFLLCFLCVLLGSSCFIVEKRLFVGNKAA